MSIATTLRLSWALGPVTILTLPVLISYRRYPKELERPMQLVRHWIGSESSWVETKLAVAGQAQVPVEHGYEPGSGRLLVFLNGQLQTPDVDYEETDHFTLSFNRELLTGDQLVLVHR